MAFQLARENLKLFVVIFFLLVVFFHCIFLGCQGSGRETTVTFTPLDTGYFVHRALRRTIIDGLFG